MAGGQGRSGSTTNLPPSGEIRNINPAPSRLSMPARAKESDRMCSYTGCNPAGGGVCAGTIMRARPTKSTAASALPPTSTPTSSTGNGGHGSARAQVQAQAQAQQRQAVNAVLLDAKNQQLRGYVHRLRAAWSPGADPGHVDGAFDEYAGMQKAALDLVRALTNYPLGQGQGQGRQRRRRKPSGRHGSVEETVERLEMLSLSNGCDEGVAALGLSLGEMRISDATHDDEDTPRTGRAPDDAWLATIRDWRAAVQKLLESHRTSLAGTYRAYEKDATPEAVERLFLDPGLRAEAIHMMTSSPNYKAFAAAPAYWPRYERRFRNHDCLKRALEDVDCLLQWGRGGLDAEDGGGDRPVREYTIAPRGDAILEFANTGADAHDSDSPVLRFRVSSHVLAETSPLFARLFSEGTIYESAWEDEDEDDRRRGIRQPPGPGMHQPRTVVCADGSEARLYSMPQREANEEDALAILLHAAHLHTDRVPRAVSLARLVAVAGACARYGGCTGPLEVVVEHLWLPAWVHEAGGDRPDGLLVVSYVFGLRGLFARVSKTAVLNLVDEEELAAKPWPRKVKDRIWAVRNAKLAQVHSVCAGAVREYFRPPMGNNHHPSSLSSRPPSPPRETDDTRTVPSVPPQPQPQHYRDRAAAASSTPSPFALTSTPRCPRGSHACDAANLGWLLLVLNELDLLGTVMVAATPPQPQPKPTSSRRWSLARLLDTLRCVPGPPGPVHPGGVCDPAPAFRAAVNDVYNSITGLTLFEVDGRRHGWALSRGKADVPQEVVHVSLGVLGVSGREEEEEQEDTVGRPLRSTADEVGDESERGGDAIESTGGGIESSLLRPSTNEDDGTRGQQRAHTPAPPFTPDEATCLRILSFLDTSDDLYAAAVTNRTFYHAFKNNELALMRRLVRANRRLTLSVLVGRPKLSQDEDEARARRLLLSSAGATEVPSDSGCAMEDSSPGGDGRSPWDASSRSVCSPLLDGAKGTTASCFMTEEEAHHILWPDQPPGAGDVPAVDAPRDVWRGTSDCAQVQVQVQSRHRGSNEKVLMGHAAFVEEKTLVLVGDKSLREQHDRKIGILSD